jgi:gluconolactonase
MKSMKNKNQSLMSILLFLTTFMFACVLLPPPPIREPNPQNAQNAPADLVTPNSSAVQSEQPSTQQSTGDSALPNHDFALVPVAGNYQFTEGPAVDSSGNVYFSDVNAGKIYKWSPNGSVSVLLEGLNKPNGLMFDKNGNLIACEGGNGRLISIDMQGQITVLVDQYNGTRFNEPNDLWIDSQGGIYFTDPTYQSSVVQDGEHVYYLSPDRSQVMRVINDLVKPNGLVGTANGKTLYVADHGAGQTFAYDVNSDGTLANKRLFAPTGSDGMDLDASGNLFLTTPNKVQIFDANGNHLQDISTQENPTNIAFGGADRLILFITARTLVYTAQMSVENSTTTISNTAGFILNSPDLGTDGRLPTEYTCDGASSTLALSWSGAPAGTQSYAVIMHHNAPDNAIHWYWVLYNIPADVTSLARNMAGIGMLGTNSVNDHNEYAPPCSKGPGDKEYIYTVYALSAQPQVTTSPVNRAALLDAIKDITLASAELHVVYARP